MKRNGFTLLELLVVIVVIGILATLVAGAAGYATRSARAKRMGISCKTLETAIHRYRTEYGEWPGGYKGKDTSKTFSGEANASVFGMLRVNSDDNPDHIRVLDETAFFTPDGDFGANKLCDATGDRPLVCQYRSGRWTKKDSDRYLYYKVTIDYDDETVTVSAPGFNDEGDDED